MMEQAVTYEAGAIDWHAVCAIEDITPGTGVCALVAGEQVALFYLGRQPGLFALGNHDPFSGANVLSRGIVGDVGGVPYVASPIYKQRFCLETGRCLDDDSVQVTPYPVRLVDQIVQVGISR